MAILMMTIQIVRRRRARDAAAVFAAKLARAIVVPVPFLVVAFTGPPGAGKSSLAALLADKLRARRRVRDVSVINVGRMKRDRGLVGDAATQDIIGDVVNRTADAAENAEDASRVDVLLLDGGFYKASVARAVLNVPALVRAAPSRSVLVVRTTANDDVAIARCAQRCDRPRDMDLTAIRRKITRRRSAWPAVREVLREAGVRVVTLDTTNSALSERFIGNVAETLASNAKHMRGQPTLALSRPHGKPA